MDQFAAGDLSRRRFLEFLGASTTAACALQAPVAAAFGNLGAKVRSLGPSLEDRLELAPGFSSYIIAKWGDVLNSQGEKFSMNADFTAVIPLANANEALLFVNHETVEPVLLGHPTDGAKKTLAQVEREQSEVGASIVKIRRAAPGAPWIMVAGDPLNRRLTARTPNKFASARPIAGKTSAVGTLANCAGGVTPWKTVLTCEENYQEYYGEVDYEKSKGGKPVRKYSEKYFGWDRHFDHSPEHYGWVVEFDPFTGDAQKLAALGRFSHEGATVVTAKDGRSVVYMGDDEADQCIYKFISAKAGSLTAGTLYVADIAAGRWVALDINASAALRGKFHDQTEVLIRTREAAKLVGGTGVDRPEGIAVDPKSGDVYVSLTNNVAKGNFFGSLLKLEESEPSALTFKSKTFLVGGESTGFACPDNICFDKRGRLWLTTDISGSKIGQDPYKAFGNNGLFCVEVRGPRAGQVVKIASAPYQAEFTGPSFTTDGKTLFMSVQHPGEKSTAEKLTSHWPAGKPDALPASAVVGLTLITSYA